MFFTADPISAERALRAGFVNEVIAEAELEQRTYAICADDRVPFRGRGRGRQAGYPRTE